MAKPELGQKQVCPSDQTKFYDLGRRPAVCPKCGYSFDPEELLKTRKVRVRAADYEEAEEKEEKVADESEELEEADETPEIDEAVEADPIETDDEDVDPDAPVVGPAAAGVDFVEDEELAEEADDDAVPFIEDDEEDFPEDDIEGLPEEGEEEER